MIGFRVRRIAFIAGLTVTGLALPAASAFGQGAEVEPNDTCATAQALGAIGDHIAFAASLDPSPSKPDVDFFRVQGTPGEPVVLRMDGAVGGAGTLTDPYLGAFDSACNLISASDDAGGTPNSRLVLVVPPDGDVIVAATSCCDGQFVGNGGAGTYRLTLGRSQTIVSIRGRLLDADTGQPLRADGQTFVELYRCSDGVCAEPPVAGTWVGEGATFVFASDPSGSPLDAGMYQLVVVTSGPSGQRIERVRTEPFTAEVGTEHDAGDIVVPRIPRARSVAGRVIDAKTGAPIGGDGRTAANVELIRCSDGGCFEGTALAQTDVDGRFVFDVDGGGNPLPLFAGSYQLRISAESYATLTTAEIALGDGADVNAGDIALQPIPMVGSISGRILDAVSRQGLPGDNRPFARVTLFGCGSSGCGTLATREADGEGRYRFETDDYGRPLPVQEYWVTALAEQYESNDSRHVRVREGQDVDLGDVALKSLPIRFSEIRSCGDLPPEGGECTYSVRVANGLPQAVDGAVWSMVSVQGTGSPLGTTRFQAGAPQRLTLPSGSSQVVRFTIDIPTRVQAGATICAEALAGRGPSPLFDTLGQRDLFCVTKRPAGYVVLSDIATAAVLRQLHTLLPLPLPVSETFGSPADR